MERAKLARSKGNEGMARVCARRAAGIVIGQYLVRRGYLNLSRSAYERLSLFSSLPDVDERLKDAVKHLLLRINPEHQLPIEVDLISEAQMLAGTLQLENNY